MKLSLNMLVLGALGMGACASKPAAESDLRPWMDPQLGRAIAPRGEADAKADDVALPAEPTADDYARLAVGRSPKVRAARHRVEQTQAMIAQARGLEDPELMVSPIGEMEEGEDGMIALMAGVEQELPFPGKLSARATAARAEAEMAKADLRMVMLGVSREARQAYWRYDGATRELEVVREAESLATQMRDAADAAYRATVGTQEDVLLAGIELAELENERVTIEARRRTAAGTLNALLDRPLDAEVPEPAETPIIEAQLRLGELLRNAATHNPELATIRRRIDTSRANARVANLEQLPDFSVGLQYNVVSRDDAMSEMATGDDEWWLTFGFNLPIWNGKYSAMRREAKSRVLADLADLQAASNTLAVRVQEMATEADTEARMARLFADTLVPQSRQALDASLASYRTGRGDFSAVIESYSRVLEYRRMYHQTRAGLASTLAELDEMTGRDLPPAQENTHDR